MPGLAGRRAVVTGANTGLGFVCARELAAAGADVVLAVRSPERGAEASRRLAGSGLSERIRVAELDLADLASVAAFAAREVAAGPLDILVNNAGLMLVPERRLTVDGFELQMGVNHLGHFALTALLLPALRHSPAARVVSVTSVAHRMAGPLDPRLNLAGRYQAFRAYAQSKLACLMFSLELDRRLRPDSPSVTSVVAHPGWVATDLFTRQPRPSLSDRLSAVFTPALATGPEAGARPELRAATDATLSGGELVGPRFLIRGAPVLEAPGRQALNREAAALLWDLSASLTGTGLR